MKYSLLFFALFATMPQLWAQDEPAEPIEEPTETGPEKVYQTFKDRYVINSQSVEVLGKRQLDFRVMHRFGDFAGIAGGSQTFFGLENAADVGFGLEYGITDNLTIGLARNKGAGPVKQLLNGFAKYAILQQTTDNKMPVSLTAVAMGVLSTAKASADTMSMQHFAKFAHRVSYSLELHVARKFKWMAIQLSPMFTWRNYVPNGDNNALFALGASMRFQITKSFGIILDATAPFSKMRWQKNSGFQMPLGIGFEFDSGGHVFQINLTNSSGFIPTDYVPYTNSLWEKGQFRLGFSIMRVLFFP